MPRPLRVEIEGGLYHVMTRGNNRQTIFHCAADYEKFLSLLSKQKYKLPYFLYAYCLMSNHVHLLIERQAAAIGRSFPALVNIGISGISRRHDNARQRAQTHRGFRLTTEQIEQEYHRITNSK
jgi:REP element-mobilizing transposase RayT